MVDYLDVLLDVGSPLADAEKVIAATRAHRPDLAGKLAVVFPRAMRGLAGFRQARPPRSRFPMPFMVTAGNIVTMCYLTGDLKAALKLMLMHRTYARPSEATSLLVEDFLRPASSRFPGLDQYALLLCPQERGQPTKTQAFDDTLILDNPRSWAS